MKIIDAVARKKNPTQKKAAQTQYCFTTDKNSTHRWNDFLLFTVIFILNSLTFERIHKYPTDRTTQSAIKMSHSILNKFISFKTSFVLIEKYQEWNKIISSKKLNSKLWSRPPLVTGKVYIQMDNQWLGGILS